MKKTLIINAHPISNSTSSVALMGLQYFLNTYNQLKAEDEVIETISLYDVEIPPLSRTVFSAWEKQAAGKELTTEEAQTLARMSEILQQFKSVQKYIIVYPLHNFNISSKLKDYMDNIFIAKETFKYTENGSVGLLKDGRSMLLIQGSGSIYTNNDWYTEVEYSYKYLKSIFNFIGIEDLEIFRVQGSSIYSCEELEERAKAEATTFAKAFAAK